MAAPHPYTFGRGTSLSSPYTIGRTGLPCPRSYLTPSSNAHKAWKVGHAEWIADQKAQAAAKGVRR